MTDTTDFDLELILKKYSLQNAIKYDGKATLKAVLGKVLAELPKLRSMVPEVTGKLEGIISDVNDLPAQSQFDTLMEIAPELLEKKEKIVKEKTLPPLNNVTGDVVMRFAPGPSGPLHIGHARAAILNDEYCKTYKGKFILRLEDTNPAKIIEDAYDMIKKDLDWLGVIYHDVIIQSERFDLYYKHAKELLEKGRAYICSCDVEDWRVRKNRGEACPHRKLPDTEQLERWTKMHDGTFAEGEASYIVKTDLEHPNPAVRDFIGFRIIDDPLHIRTGDKYRVYPLMNFSVAVDDHLLGLTHVLRGKDHLNNTYRQEYIYDYLNWTMPEYIHYGWVSIEDTILKTSEITKKIGSGEITDWNDVRLGTFRAFASRGIRPEAIRRYWLDVGTKEVDVKFSWDTLYAFNRGLVDKSAPRYFFVPEPVKLNIIGINELEGHAPVHPEFPERGERKVKLTAGAAHRIEIHIPSEEWKGLANVDLFRLKDLCNVKPDKNGNLEYSGTDISVLKSGEVKIIQWVSGKSHLKVELKMPDGSIITGAGENDLKNSIGELVQFERVGFAKISESKKPGIDLTAIYCHK